METLNVARKRIIGEANRKFGSLLVDVEPSEHMPPGYVQRLREAGVRSQVWVSMAVELQLHMERAPEEMVWEPVECIPCLAGEVPAAYSLPPELTQSAPLRLHLSGKAACELRRNTAKAVNVFQIWCVYEASGWPAQLLIARCCRCGFRCSPAESFNPVCCAG